MNGASAEGVGAHETDPGALRIGGVVAGIRDRAWTLTVWGALLVWAGALFLIVRDRYADFRFGRYDLGNMVQAVWSTAHGRPLEFTDGATGEQIVRLGRHVDPILAALAPLWIAVPSPLTLAALQILAVALGALPVFWLGRRHTGSDRTAALIALAYLAYPWVAWTALDAFHPVTLAIPLLLFGVWFLDGDRVVPFAICAALVATTGELMGFVIAALGIWYAVVRRRTRAGVAIAVAGVAASVVALYVVVPEFSGGPSVYYGPFDDVGGSPQGLLRTALSEPTAILSAVSEGRDLLYVVLLSAPLAGAFLLSPGLAAVALPQLAVNLLADVRARPIRTHTTSQRSSRFCSRLSPWGWADLPSRTGCERRCWSSFSRSLPRSQWDHGRERCWVPRPGVRCRLPPNAWRRWNTRSLSFRTTRL